MTLTELVRRVRERWRLVIGGALIGLVAGTAVHLAMPTRYQAFAVVRVDAPEPDQVDMVAEQATATSRRVMSEALDALDTDLTLDELESSTRVETVKGSRVLRVIGSAASAADAARGADAVAQAYLAVRAVDSAGDPTAPSAAVVDPARIPGSAAGPTLLAVGAGGLTLGLLLAIPWAARPQEAVPEPPIARPRGGPATYRDPDRWPGHRSGADGG